MKLCSSQILRYCLSKLLQLVNRIQRQALFVPDMAHPRTPNHFFQVMEGRWILTTVACPEVAKLDPLRCRLRVNLIF